MFKNPNGQVWDDAGQVYVADDWYRVEWSAKIPDDTVVLSLQYYANAAGTFYINDLLITTDGSIDLPKGLTLDTTATPELNPDNSFWQAPYLYVGAGTAITNFKRPWVGKPFTLLFTDTRTITNNANIKLNGAANFDGVAGDNMTLMYNGLDNICYEQGRHQITNQTYTATNVVTDRSYDANATSVDELADVLGTLIADLRAKNVIN
jgi:hypothetical protein